MPDKVDLSGDFYQQLENIQNAVRLTPEQAMAVNNLYNDLELVLQQEWPGDLYSAIYKENKLFIRFDK